MIAVPPTMNSRSSLQMPTGGGRPQQRDHGGNGYVMGPAQPGGYTNIPAPQMNNWTEQMEAFPQEQLRREQQKRDEFLKQPIHGRYQARVANPSVEEIAGAYIAAEQQALEAGEPIYRTTMFMADSKFCLGAGNGSGSNQSRLTWGLATFSDGNAGTIVLNDTNLQNIVSMRLNPFTVPIEMAAGLYYGTVQLQVNSFAAPDMSAYSYSGGVNSVAATLFHFDCTLAVNATNAAIMDVVPLNSQYVFLKPSSVPNNQWIVSVRSPLSAVNLQWPSPIVTAVANAGSSPLSLTLSVPVASLGGLKVTIDTTDLLMSYVPYGAVYVLVGGGGSTVTVVGVDGTNVVAGTKITLCFLHRVSRMNFRLDSLDREASLADSTRVVKTMAST